MGKKAVKQEPKWEIVESNGAIASRALTKLVVEVLRSAPAQKINFLFNAVIVSGTRLAEVASAIEKFKIIVYYDSKKVYAPGATDAYYSSTEDAIFLGFKDLGNIENQMLLIHECVHAINDIYGSAGVSKLDDECAGYAASAYYYRNAGNPYPKRPKATLALVDNLYQAAFDLADCYIDKIVNPSDAVEVLRSAVLATPIYKKAKTVKMAYDGLTHLPRAGTYFITSLLSR